VKLASLKHGRDGRLVVVSDDLTSCVDAQFIAPTLQAALDDWARCAAPLRALADALNAGRREGAPFDPAHAAAPLPRAYQWADGSAYVNHVALVRQARGATLPERFWTDPLIYQGGSDGFLGARDPILLADEAWGADLEAEIAVIVDDVPQGVSAEAARAHIQLIMLVNDVSLRNLIPGELEKGFGFFQSKPASAFSPVAVTPDALGAAWSAGKLHLPLQVSVRNAPFGRANAGEDMTFDFGALIAHAAKTRALAAGTIIGSGTVSNRDADGGPGRPIAEGGRGYSCIAEQRMVETLRIGAARTPFLAPGDRVTIEMHDANDRSIFGRIDQLVVRA
jgi:fumarylacetoacetate (FAA) hydrolase